MARDTASRKWQLTINNPSEKGFSHEKIKELLNGFSSLLYWCMSDELGEKHTYHTHIYIAFKNAVMFSTMQKTFDGAHFEMAKGTSQQNRDYVFKEGKWLKDKKKETNLVETHEEFGDMPLERQGARNDIADLYDMIKDGKSNYEILEENPTYMMNIEKVEKVRQIVRDAKYKDAERMVKVKYIYGGTGVGKTSTLPRNIGYSQIYRVNKYDHPFDNYKGENIIMFDEFRGQIPISEMLTYIDIHPCWLPSRYNDKVACYHEIYIVSNYPLEMLYPNVQNEHFDTWKAFLRRIHNVVEMTSKYSNIYTVEQYLKRDSEFVNVKSLDNYIQEQIPF